jgi:hypothetical protein
MPTPNVWDLVMSRELTASDRQDLKRMNIHEQREWLLAHGAVFEGVLQFRLLVQSRAAAPILIRGIRTQVVRRHRSICKTVVTSPSAGAAVATLLLFDLDQDHDEAWEGQEDGFVARVGEVPYFEAHQVELEPGHTEQFRIRATVTVSFVEWALVVDLEQAGRRRQVRVRAPDGGPFRTTAGPPGGYEQRWMTGVAAGQEGLRPADPALGE